MKLIIDIDEDTYNRIKDGNALLNDLDALCEAMMNGKPYEDKPQGEWLFTEIDENFHVYGQCSVCKERNRIGKACRSCGAEMKGSAE